MMKPLDRISGFLLAFIAVICFISAPNKAIGQSEQPIVSDDFSTTFLNSNVWTFIDPQGDAKITLTGAQAVITVPSGQSHDVWTTGNMAPRIMQPARDEDFEIEVKFESLINQMYQLQGVIIEQDDNHFLRFDFYSDGSKTRIFAAIFKNGRVSVKSNLVIANGLALYMRVSRLATQWTQSYSYDGVNWLINTSFFENLNVTSVGAFAGNSGIKTPAHAGVLDYFFNTAAPIEPEDGGRFTITSNITGDGSVAKNPDYVTYLPGELVELTAIPDPGLSFHAWSGALSGNDNPLTITLADDIIIGATFTAGDDPVIDLWYGSNQVFGNIGIPQRWINLLGNVSDYDGIAQLTYSLNGGTALPLSFGPPNPRLLADGDFNIEFAYANLSEGQNTVSIQAVDMLGNTISEEVNLEFVGGKVWPENYSIDWHSVNKIDEVAQVVDGSWNLEANAIRTVAPGYDRLIAIGDTSWKDYEVTVPITIHGFDFQAGGAIVGILMRWEGHIDWGSHKPVTGWWPMGAIGVYQPQDVNSSRGSLRIIGDASVDLAEDNNHRLALGVPYIFKMRVETIPGQGGLYKLKVWEDGTPEPSEWNLVAQEDDTDTPNGSFLLVAHNTDASFGNVTVVPVKGQVINNIQVTRSEKSATINWLTSRPTTGSVAYGQTEAYEEGNVSDTALTGEHSITLSNLIMGTQYHFQITSVDSDGNVASSPDLTFTTLVASNIESDAFNDQQLNTGIWSFIDPFGDANMTMTGNEAAISVPAGTSHDVWTTGNLAPRIMQPANNTDFEIEVKFASEMNQGFQIQGILIEENDRSFLRFDFHYNGSNTRIFAAAFTDGNVARKINSRIHTGVPLFMRVKREGDQWTQSYCYDGKTWKTSVKFTHALSVSSVGAFVGNAGSNAPAHTGLIDYFVNTASSKFDTRPPVITNIQAIRSNTFATIKWTTDEPATSHVAYGQSGAYEYGSIHENTLKTEHAINLTGLTPGKVYHYKVYSADSSGNTACSSDSTLTTTDVPVSVYATADGPVRFELHQNYPNPFNPVTTIAFDLPAPGFVNLNIFNANGEEVAVLVAETLSVGRHKTVWNANGFPSGAYFYRLSIASSAQKAPLTATKKLLLVK